MTISTILLVPEEGDPHGLLAEGVCGARPPTMFYREPFNRWQTGSCIVEGARSVTHALVLAYDGKPVPEGCDRLDWRMHDGRGTPGRIQTWSHTPMPPGISDDLWPAYEKGWIAAALNKMGRLIFLDAAGNEVTP